MREVKVNLSVYFIGKWSFKSGTGNFGKYEYLLGAYGELWESIEKQFPKLLSIRPTSMRNRATLSLLEDEYNG
tara:strand:+ start:1081 stop:1299 length:219 start_codon:yes stop_codon:yes gene_type:complete